jgi:DNA-binding response OmpR family regulator
MTTPEHILIVDDDAEIRSLLGDYLQKSGYRTTSVAEGKGMLAALESGRVDLIVLDLMLPGDDGLVLCRNLRARSDIPVIMLTARGEDMDRILGLEMGADDYLPKPFNPRELVARIHAVLRRKAVLPVGAPEIAEKTVSFSDFELNLATRQLRRSGVAVTLTTGEFALLKVLVTHPRLPMSRDKLMELARGREHDPFDRAIDVQVSRLRKLIEVDPAQPRFIQTIWGHGYVFVPDGTKP